MALPCAIVLKLVRRDLAVASPLKRYTTMFDRSIPEGFAGKAAVVSEDEGFMLVYPETSALFYSGDHTKFTYKTIHLVVIRNVTGKEFIWMRSKFKRATSRMAGTTSWGALVFLGYTFKNITLEIAIDSEAKPGLKLFQDHIIEIQHSLGNLDLPQFLAVMNKLNEKFAALQPVSCSADALLPLLSRCYTNLIKPGLSDLAVPADKSFSEEVYGELLPPFLDHIFREAQLTKNSIFLDLGSGVGNAVVQAATTIKCKSFGIELRDVASTLAETLIRDIQRRSDLWGIHMGAVEVVQATNLVPSSVRQLQLAGIRLTPVPRIAKAIVYAASYTITLGLGGSSFWVPDGGALTFMIPKEEFKPGVYQLIDAKSNSTSVGLSGPRYYARFLKDVTPWLWKPLALASTSATLLMLGVRFIMTQRVRKS
ncbi:hypothetical protein D9757_008602 [Collybiopsis confluens]|uniref:Histone-lysine N-methyltransferase, H3 lysine-79 specific n=1 Tax=Collybiopsis confluens TaxID=2823264 RepID=A0A8H5HN40_9AGAR|nr:hypothetical protein D9757_008602 [Collybiopsis confluens]